MRQQRRAPVASYCACSLSLLLCLLQSLRLAEYLLSAYRSSSFPSRVIELGSGVGFLGSLVAQLMQRSRDAKLVLTDFDQRVLDGLEANLKLSEYRF